MKKISILSIKIIYYWAVNSKITNKNYMEIHA